MTRTSAIFGVVSVLTAAIVGGVFIRKKIIFDNLYEKELLELEALWKKKVRDLESYINDVNVDLRRENKNKENIEKYIERYKKEIKELSKDIKEIEEKMQELEHYHFTGKNDRIITKNLNKQTDLKSKIDSLNLENNEENDFEKKISNLKEFLKNQQDKIQIYVGHRIALNSRFKNNKFKKNEKIELKKKFEEELKNNESLLSNLNNSIEVLIKTLNEKTLQLSNLIKQNPRQIG